MPTPEDKAALIARLVAERNAREQALLAATPAPIAPAMPTYAELAALLVKQAQAPAKPQAPKARRAPDVPAPAKPKRRDVSTAAPRLGEPAYLASQAEKDQADAYAAAIRQAALDVTERQDSNDIFRFIQRGIPAIGLRCVAVGRDGARWADSVYALYTRPLHTGKTEFLWYCKTGVTALHILRMLRRHDDPDAEALAEGVLFDEQCQCYVADDLPAELREVLQRFGASALPERQAFASACLAAFPALAVA